MKLNRIHRVVLYLSINNKNIDASSELFHSFMLIYMAHIGVKKDFNIVYKRKPIQMSMQMPMQLSL